METGLGSLRCELGNGLADAWMQDIDRMISHHPAEVLIAAQDPEGFTCEMRGVIRSASLVRLHDLERGADDRQGEIDAIRSWMQRALPGGKVPTGYPYDFSANALNGKAVPPPAVHGAGSGQG